MSVVENRKSSETLRGFVGHIVPDISKDFTVVIFKLKQSKEVRKLLKNRAV
jgi:hypothetical protein